MTVITRKKQPLKTRIVKDIKKNWLRYLMILPVIVYFVVWHYWPMYGVTIAFKKFNPKLGIIGSPWIGLDQFERFFNAYNFKSLIINTLSLSIYSLITEFPIAIIFALFLNYLKSRKLKKCIQMVSYAPHFISTVVLCGMVSLFCTRDIGAFNVILSLLGKESVDFLAKPEWFKSIYVWSGVWQNMGWNAIIYISALAGVDQQMHEAAIIDGASKIQRMLYIDIPSIKPTIIMMLILRFGQVMNIGFEKSYLLQNSLNLSASEIISTYTYKVGMIDSNYSYSAAVGLFNAIINVILLVSANQISKKIADESLF